MEINYEVQKIMEVQKEIAYKTLQKSYNGPKIIEPRAQLQLFI